MVLFKDEIILMAKLSNFSYLSKEEIKKIYNNRPYEKEYNFLNEVIIEPEFFSTSLDCQYILVYFKDYLVVSYRGTSSKADIFTDLKFFRTRMFLENYIDFRNKPYVHLGFFNQFNSSRPDLDLKLKEYVKNYKFNSIIFTGHSLGGALATLGALDYSYRFWDYPISCITYGSPRVGCHTFAKIFNKKIKNSLRFVNDNDPVPCIPTAWNYKHVNGCRWLNQDKIESEIQVYRGWRFLKNSFLNIFGHGYDAIRDHSCSEYIKDLEIIL